MIVNHFLLASFKNLLSDPLLRITSQDPELIYRSPNIVEQRLISCLGLLVEKQQIPGSVADKVLEEYTEFCQIFSVTEVVKSFCHHNRRLDEFYIQTVLECGKSFPSLLKLFKHLLILTQNIKITNKREKEVALKMEKKDRKRQVEKDLNYVVSIGSLMPYCLVAEIMLTLEVLDVVGCELLKVWMGVMPSSSASLNLGVISINTMILNRLLPVVEPLLIPQQAGFRPGESCIGQLLNPTLFIEDGFEARKGTRAVFVDLSAAYDTVNHQLLVIKICNMTMDYSLSMFITTLLQNHRFFVDFQGQHSRWRLQKKGLGQGSVLSPILFNIYTIDQPIASNSRSFFYSVDLALPTQSTDFESVESTLINALEGLSRYYITNQLIPNSSKTQVCAFHLRNREVTCKLKLVLSGVELEHCDTTKYLGVTLDRSLTFKKHCMNSKLKVSTGTIF
ncbi:hypothetical protein PR048_001423 [Dryococelus australis]|uniref:Reverse transcriptase domain-containing protein n=1 Tax=Dryococelus australis TaxID=614101 RepID=A0ABQ9IHF1_9NEOP|nr:hypothetical protein PR048_001423 [Dryococelus australis]